MFGRIFQQPLILKLLLSTAIYCYLLPTATTASTAICYLLIPHCHYFIPHCHYFSIHQLKTFFLFYSRIIHNFCTKSEDSSSNVLTPAASSFEPHLINIGGSELYYLFKSHLEVYLSEITKAAPTGLLQFGAILRCTG